ncbi:MAG: glycosyl transferase [Gemmatimonadetes bacterium]|nr:glycosyl transferase [Gemmatimonadota bacterium]
MGGARPPHPPPPPPAARGGGRLSNGRLTSRLTAAGAGGVDYRGVALTRAAPDSAGDGPGVWIYVRDLDTGDVWSATRHPVRREPDAYEARLGAGVVSFRRTDDGIETRLDVCIPATDDVELRRIRLANRSGRPRRLEVTTYAEVVLAPAAADAAHPAFSKLFVETEHVAESDALLARRRPRAPGDAPLWLAHALAGGTPPAAAAAGHETDRARFLGRGRSTAAPAALDPGATLSGTVGAVLDPVVSLRRCVELPPGEATTLVAVLAAAPDCAAALELATRWTGRDAVRDGGRVDTTFAEAAAAEPAETPAAAPPVPAGAPARYRPATPADAAIATSAAATTAADADVEPLRHFNGFGGFSADGTEYVLRLAPGPAGPLLPPLPWTHVVANEETGFIASERGAASTWSVNSRENRLTPWPNDPVSDPHVEALYLRDEDAGVFWSPQPGPVPAPAPYEVRYGFGYARWRTAAFGIEQDVVAFVPRRSPAKLVRLRLTNRSGHERRLSIVAYAQWVLGSLPPGSGRTVVTERDAATGAILATNPANGEFAGRVAFAALLTSDLGPVEATADRTAFLGEGGDVAHPAALRGDAPLDGRTGAGLDPCAAFRRTFVLGEGASWECTFVLGQAATVEKARACVAGMSEPAAVDRALAEARAFWAGLTGRIRVRTPADALDLMVNGWLVYQTLACRLWARSAFYQSGGAFGFRDQLQDAAALVYVDPALTRRQILLHAAHQFPEGDVLHWWHPPTAKGIRTRFADDLLWLPYVTAFYLATTGDRTILDEAAPFVTARALEPGEDEAFVFPTPTGTTASLYEHCCAALDRSLTTGAHGLPLIGTGDWNDGMNRVGREGRGESVWLGFFLFAILEAFIPLCAGRGDAARAHRYHEYRERLRHALNDAGWDGEWYRRAFYDDGAPLGSRESDECRIDAIAQAWAVLSGAAPPERARQALDALEAQLVDERAGLIRLLAPPFDRTPHDPGYIKGYVPGVRENGGQYTHGALWAVRALAEAGRAERAAPLLEMLSPVSHARSRQDVEVYRVEPYVIAADIYGVPPHVGRGGWTWYTGSAGWMLRVALESILGLTVEEGRILRLRPCIPAAWPGFALRYALPDRAATYEIEVRRGDGATTATLDGAPLAVADGAVAIPVRRDGGVHRVDVVLGEDVGPRYRER